MSAIAEQVSYFDETEPYEYASYVPERDILGLDSYAPRPTVASEPDVIPIAPAIGSREIIEAIERSRSILKLRTNWDGEGAEGYSFATWSRATQFLSDLTGVARRQLAARLPLPLISPAEHGSIDLFWKTADRTLLVNFPSDQASFVSFHGELADGSTTSGRFKSDSENVALAVWLTTKL